MRASRTQSLVGQESVYKCSISLFLPSLIDTDDYIRLMCGPPREQVRAIPVRTLVPTTGRRKKHAALTLLEAVTGERKMGASFRRGCRRR